MNRATGVVVYRIRGTKTGPVRVESRIKPLWVVECRSRGWAVLSPDWKREHRFDYHIAACRFCELVNSGMSEELALLAVEDCA